MLAITKQQALERWGVLPEILREALFSEENFNFVEKACQDNHLPEDKIKAVATAVGDVIFGFIHPEDLAKEIKDSAGINILIAEAISKEVFKKVFLPIKEDIDKIYFPVAPVKPEGVVDLKSQGKPMMIGVESGTLEIKPKEIFGASSNERRFPDVNKATLEKSLAEESSFVSAYAKASVDKKTTADEEAPMILHKETELTPVSAQKKSLAEAFTFSSGNEPKAKIRTESLAAKITLGREEQNGFGKKTQGGAGETPQNRKNEENKKSIHMDRPAVKVVHYSDLTPPPVAPIPKGKTNEVIFQSKETNIAFEPKIIKTDDEKKKESFGETQDGLEKIFSGPPKSQISEITSSQTQMVGVPTVNGGEQEKKKISVPPIEQASIKIEDSRKFGFSKPEPRSENQKSKEELITEKKPTEEVKIVQKFTEKKENLSQPTFGAPEKNEQKPTSRPLNEIQLKDIPVEEDVIDLRKIAQE